MPKVSLTSFIDYLATSGTPKLTRAREMVKMEGKEYQHFTDFWGHLRNAILKLHREGGSNFSLLSDCVAHADTRRQQRYREAVAGYQKFLGKNPQYEWFEPPRTTWTIDDLHIRINPELGLKNKDESLVIKLYFRNNKPGKRKFDLVTRILTARLADQAPEATFCVLDVANAKLVRGDGWNPDPLPLIQVEATGLQSLLKDMQAQ